MKMNVLPQVLTYFCHLSTVTLELHMSAHLFVVFLFLLVLLPVPHTSLTSFYDNCLPCRRNTRHRIQLACERSLDRVDPSGGKRSSEAKGHKIKRKKRTVHEGCTTWTASRFLA